ncbi:hypothetical protein SAMN03159496_00278 [Rhizobium sp. NFR07]|nr:hypothetical protein SAMN03159496_00278 [Rhizobium sp. NFR07]
MPSPKQRSPAPEPSHTRCEQQSGISEGLRHNNAAGFLFAQHRRFDHANLVIQPLMTAIDAGGRMPSSIRSE